MWVCPICKQSKRLDRVCARCGFDMRSDFLALRTVTPVTEDDKDALNECINREAERKLQEALARDLKRYEKEREEWEKKNAEEQAHLERERKAKEERARLERERKAKEEQARLERERKAKEERARLERERKAKEEQARLERERKAKEEQARLERERKEREEQTYRKQREDLEKKIKNRRKWLLGILAAIVVCVFIPTSVTLYTGIVLLYVDMVLAVIQIIQEAIYKRLPAAGWEEQERSRRIEELEKKIKSRQKWIFWILAAAVIFFFSTVTAIIGVVLILADIVLLCSWAVCRGVRKRLIAGGKESQNGTE